MTIWSCFGHFRSIKSTICHVINRKMCHFNDTVEITIFFFSYLTSGLFIYTRQYVNDLNRSFVHQNKTFSNGLFTPLWVLPLILTLFANNMRVLKVQKPRPTWQLGSQTTRKCWWNLLSLFYETKNEQLPKTFGFLCQTSDQKYPIVTRILNVSTFSRVFVPRFFLFYLMSTIEMHFFLCACALW